MEQSSIEIVQNCLSDQQKGILHYFQTCSITDVADAKVRMKAKDPDLWLRAGSFTR